MTAKERANPALLNAKRKKRIAAGSGRSVQEVNKILKMHQEMGRAMKQIKKMGGMKGLAAMFGAGGGGAMGGAPSGAPGLPAAACRAFRVGSYPRKCRIFSRRNKFIQEFGLER